MKTGKRTLLAILLALCLTMAAAAAPAALTPVGRCVGITLRTEGVTVIGFAEDGSAARDAGIRQGDRILAIDGTPVDSPEGIRALLRPGERVVLRVQRGGCLLAYRQRDALGQAQQSALRRNGRAALGSLTAPGRDSAVDSSRGPADKLKGDSNGYCAECFKEPEARQLRTDLDALARYNQKAYRRRGDSDSRLLGAEHNSRVQG